MIGHRDDSAGGEGSQGSPGDHAGAVRGAGNLAFGLAADFPGDQLDRKSTRLNSSHVAISYAVFCLKEENDVCGVSGGYYEGGGTAGRIVDRPAEKVADWYARCG